MARPPGMRTGSQKGGAMRVRRLIVIMIVVGLGGIFALDGTAAAGPTKVPEFGVVDPLDANPTTFFSPAPGVVFTGSCPWPNSVDQVLPEVEKCLPGSIGWSPDGVRIVSDPLEPPVSTSTASGSFTFWCQSRTGLRYMLRVEGLAARQTYTVRAVPMGTEPALGVIAAFRSDQNGAGGVNGSIRLPGGIYHYAIQIHDANHQVVLQTVPGDEIGFDVA